MSATLAAFVEPGDTIETPLWDEREQRPLRAVVTAVYRLGERFRVIYRYPSGHEAHQMLRGHDLIPVPSDNPSVGTG